LSKVAHSPQQPVGDPWRAARPSSKLCRALLVDAHIEQLAERWMIWVSSA
jgi:hypothetical protein